MKQKLACVDDLNKTKTKENLVIISRINIQYIVYSFLPRNHLVLFVVVVAFASHIPFRHPQMIHASQAFPADEIHEPKACRVDCICECVENMPYLIAHDP